MKRSYKKPEANIVEEGLLEGVFADKGGIPNYLTSGHWDNRDQNFNKQNNRITLMDNGPIFPR